jgi:hypothetical protein
MYKFLLKNTLETGVEDEKIHSKRAEKIENYTRNECKISTVVISFAVYAPIPPETPLPLGRGSSQRLHRELS